MSNNRFKYRVWDKKNSEYVPEGDIGDVHCLLHRDGTLDCGIAYDDGYAGGIDWVETEDAIIEQCTGLHDKNGKLIFEGDAALFDNGTSEIKGATICFTGSGFCAKWDGGHTTPLHAINDIIEIIGNIHEMEVDK